MCPSLNEASLCLLYFISLQGLPGNSGLKGEGGDPGPQVSKKLGSE